MPKNSVIENKLKKDREVELEKEKIIKMMEAELNNKERDTVTEAPPMTEKIEVAK